MTAPAIDVVLHQSLPPGVAAAVRDLPQVLLTAHHACGSTNAGPRWSERFCRNLPAPASRAMWCNRVILPGRMP